MEEKAVEVARILNPTSIDLGDFVINPFKGCEYSCIYCYVKSNKAVKKEKRRWGDYVDVRINSPEALEREIAGKRPERVLLGSTTECFQPLERKYRVTRKILEILSAHRVRYSILTRSPLISEYITILNQGCCENIYFTVNDYPEDVKRLLEPRSPAFALRMKAIDELLENGLPVIPYFSPVLPRISDYSGIFSRFPKARSIGFEGLNFNLGNISEVISVIGSVCPGLKPLYEEMAQSAERYDEEWRKVRKEIMRLAIKAKKNHDVYIHKLYAYFENTYKRELSAEREIS